MKLRVAFGWRPTALKIMLVCTAVAAFAFKVAAAPAPVRTTVTANGLVADLYTPAEMNGRLPAIIVLGGSEGGLGNAGAWEAWLIASHGYVALHVSYFNAPGQTQRLALIPLEYFKTAIDWLRSQPEVDPDRVGIMGTSIGGETALVVASYYSEIKIVIAAAPSSVIWDQRPRHAPAIDLHNGQPAPAGPTLRLGGWLHLDLRPVRQRPDGTRPASGCNHSGGADQWAGDAGLRRDRPSLAFLHHVQTG
jgi:acetyl esterase/lipase